MPGRNQSQNKGQTINSKCEESWVFIGRIDVEAETLILWPPDAKSWLIWKDSDASSEHHQLNEHGFGWTPGVSDGQGGLVCCGSWGCKELYMTEPMNWTEMGGNFWPRNSFLNSLYRYNFTYMKLLMYIIINYSFFSTVLDWK